MAKKGKKKGASFSSSHNLSSQNDSTAKEIESCDKLLIDETKVPHQFTVLLDFDETYAKLLKSSNVMLVHPSIILSFHAPKYFLVSGKSCLSLCIPYHLKDVKRSTVVFRNCTHSYKNGDLVSLIPYTKSVWKAANVTVSFNEKRIIDEYLKKQVLNLLESKRYIYPGMTIQEKYIQFTITDILSEEGDTTCGLNSFETSGFKNSSLNSTFNETNKKLVSSTFIDGHCYQSSSQLNTMFSSMCLGDNELQDSHHKEHCSQSDVSGLQLEEIPQFYTLTDETSISILGDDDKLEVSWKSFSDIGGLKNELTCIKNFIDKFLTTKSILYKLGILLLLGPPGTGKTLTLDALQAEYNVHFEKILWSQLYIMSRSDIERELQQIFQRANEKSPCIILLDDFNYLCPKAKDAQDQHISKCLARCIGNCDNYKVVIVAAANNSEFNVDVLKAGETRLKELKFRIPSSEDREEIFIKLLSDKQHCLSPEEMTQCVMHSQGFTGRDLSTVLNDAVTFHHMRAQENQIFNDVSDDGAITFEDIKQALRYKKPSIVGSNMKITKVRWSDIGGMKDVKEKLKDIVEGPLKHPEIYKRLGVKPSGGILLFGPPGCSKTMIAKALATECDLNFLSKNVSDIQNKYVGESEKAVRDLFQLAREKSPCIIFLDEIDALAARRESSSGSDVEKRIVNLFLKEMDGFEGVRNVIIIAATNRPDRLDDAFIRHGRINHFIYIPLPDIESREEILKLQMKKRKVAEDFDYKYLALKTEGYSGAEIVNICNEAAFQVLEENTEAKLENFYFTLRHFENAMKSVSPRTPAELLDFYKNYNAKFG